MPQSILLSTQTHAHHHWQPVQHQSDAAQRALAPLAFDELSTAAGRFVLGFIKAQAHYQLVALLGPGFNAYVHPHDGRWLSTYIPAHLRGAPFELGTTADAPEVPKLCLHPEALIGPEQVAEYPDSHPLFTPDGQLAERSAQVFNFLHQRLKGQLALDLISAELTDLLEPWPLTLPNQGEETPVTGFYRIDEQALKALSGERLAALNQRQALAVAYAQLISIGHLRELSKRCELIDQLRAARPQSLDLAAMLNTGDDELHFDFG